MKLSFSFIIPVYNRPEEIRELLESFLLQTYEESFEIVVIEDGSVQKSDQVIAAYKGRLSITYLVKPNTGPGDSRNYGMKRAKGTYFIVLDSDCILPPTYLKVVSNALQEKYVDCYGGPDAAHASFSKIQKAINYVMTAFLTTGGIRGKKDAVDKFQPRSFNMGISKKAFEATSGFGNIHPGEDPDLTIRLWAKGYETCLIEDAFVYHKRRIDWNKFFIQVHKFGMVRPILNKWHPQTAKITYWFPTVFCLGFLLAVALVFLVKTPYGYLLLAVYGWYLGLLFLDSLWKNKSLSIALLSLIAVWMQFVGYGYGFLKSTILVNFSNRKPEHIFPKLFFKTP